MEDLFVLFLSLSFLVSVSSPRETIRSIVDLVHWREENFSFFSSSSFSSASSFISQRRERERERSVKDHHSPFREFAIIFSDRKLARIWAEKTRRSDEINAPPSFHRLLSLEVSNAEGYPSQPFFFWFELNPSSDQGRRVFFLLLVEGQGWRE